MARDMKPGWVPYRWYWFLGSASLVLAALFAISGFWITTITSGSAGVAMILVGFVERYKGAPPL